MTPDALRLARIAVGGLLDRANGGQRVRVGDRLGSGAHDDHAERPLGKLIEDRGDRDGRGTERGERRAVQDRPQGERGLVEQQVDRLDPGQAARRVRRRDRRDLHPGRARLRALRRSW